MSRNRSTLSIRRGSLATAASRRPLRIAVALGLAAAVLAWSPDASAQRAVEVTPAVQLHEGPPGAPVDGMFTVTNPTDVPVRVRVYLSDWHYLADGTPNYLEAGSLPRSLASFVTVNPSELLLEPGASTDVRYSVDLPPDVDPGSYWGVLFMEGEDVDPEPGFELARFNVRVGHVIYVNVPPLRPDGLIAGIFGEPPSGDAEAYVLGIQYVNTGNAVQRLDGYVELRDAAGTTLFRESMPPLVSLPGDAVGRTFDVFGPLDAGNYTALVVYNYGDESTDVVADYTFALEKPLSAPPTDGAESAGAPSPDLGTAEAAGEGP